MKVLVVDDDAGLRLSLSQSLNLSKKFETTEAVDGLDAVEKTRKENFDVVLLDVDMPRLNGLEALKLIKENNPGQIVIIMTAFATIDHAVLAVKDGAYNYLSKPVQTDELMALIDKALQAQSLISRAAASAPVLHENGKKFVGGTQQMQKVFHIIHRLSKVDTPVLIRGPSGTGKELVAKAIHFNSARKDGKFVAINCSAIPENLFESELFGHEKGSFTGADLKKIGKFQFAEGGTLFLDEVGDLPPVMQVKLLRVLQEKVFTPVGSLREIPTNVRILAATNRPLEEMNAKGTFREDLFYRLNVIPIFLPSLAERKEDLDNLIHYFIKKFNLQHGKKIAQVSQEALRVLKKYGWPGNIRELENVIEHMFIMENSQILTMSSLPEAILAATGTILAIGRDGNWSEDDSTDDNEQVSAASESEDGEEPVAFDPSVGTALDFNLQKESFEKEFIIKALKTFKGRINQTALHANIPKKTLLRKIEKYGIHAKDYSGT